MNDDPDANDAPRSEGVAELARLMAAVEVGMLTTRDADEGLMSRPMRMQEVEFDGDLWFFTKEDGRKVGQVRRDPRVNVTFASRSSWVSVTGEAEVVRDQAKARDLWNAEISAWFCDGPEDPELVLLKVHVDGAEYWSGPDKGVASVLSFIKSRVTGTPYRVEDRKLEL